MLGAALLIVAVFAGGYAVANQPGGSASAPRLRLVLRGTSFAPRARATLDVWHPRDGNLPIALSVVGLPTLPRRLYYEVFLVHDGRPLGSAGAFRVKTPSRLFTLTMNAPFALRKGDSWVVTRERAERDAGTPVLRSVYPQA
jgi:hypothetical protein